MKLSLAKYYNRRVGRAIAEFDLLSAGDRVVVGFSGGKDSAFLLYALKTFQQSMAINFDLIALTIDLGFDDKQDFSSLNDYCNSLGVEHYIKRTDIAKIIKKHYTQNPCAKCAYFRRGAIAKFMKEKGFNKLAYGHHYDDAVETFLMSTIYSGQLKTFEPKSYLSESDIYVIRPLVYIRESDILSALEEINYQPIEKICPYDGETKREEIKNLIKSFEDDNQIFYNIAAAMREGGKTQLWPEELPKDKILEKTKKIWRKNNI